MKGLKTIREGRNIVIHDELSRTQTKIQVEKISPEAPTRIASQVDLNRFRAFKVDPQSESEDSPQSIKTLESLIELHAPVRKRRIVRKRQKA
mmetsp:Transcript_23052/g.35668  ORF Transcript_23052/g.35668 Transcript_23052/m.35668 type:complete len:92 (-) Transcript_23052:1038-1313(-)